MIFFKKEGICLEEAVSYAKRILMSLVLKIYSWLLIVIVGMLLVEGNLNYEEEIRLSRATIAKRRRHGDWIEVDNRPVRGARFMVFLRPEGVEQ